MYTSEANFGVPEGTILQLPSEEAVKWMRGMLETSQALIQLIKHFESQGYTFYIERSKVFVHAARDAKDMIAPSALGILPSFVPATAADEGHPAVGISVHHSGYALATSVIVSHKPFGVTEFALHEIVPGKKAIRSTKLSVEEVVQEAVGALAQRLHPPALPKGTMRTTKAALRKLPSFTTMPPGDQGLLIGTVVHQLLADNYSRALFPPEYAQALRMQTPTFQKFAFATRERFKGTILGVTLSTSSSTSSNICTSTSTSTIEI